MPGSLWQPVATCGLGILARRLGVWRLEAACGRLRLGGPGSTTRLHPGGLQPADLQAWGDSLDVAVMMSLQMRMLMNDDKAEY